MDVAVSTPVIRTRKGRISGVHLGPTIERVDWAPLERLSDAFRVDVLVDESGITPHAGFVAFSPKKWQEALVTIIPAIRQDKMYSIVLKKSADARRRSSHGVIRRWEILRRWVQETCDKGEMDRVWKCMSYGESRKGYRPERQTPLSTLVKYPVRPFNFNAVFHSTGLTYDELAVVGCKKTTRVVDADRNEAWLVPLDTCQALFNPVGVASQI